MSTPDRSLRLEASVSVRMSVGFDLGSIGFVCKTSRVTRSAAHVQGDSEHGFALRGKSLRDKSFTIG